MRLFVLAAAVGVFLLPAQAQDDNKPSVHVPQSSQEGPFDLGVKAHTNHLVFLGHSSGSGGTGGPLGLWPSTIQKVYGNVAPVGTGVIALVDAFDYPTALADFTTFSNTFHLPLVDGSNNSLLQVVYASGTQPAYNSGWSQEAALDIEWAHAMAPYAKIVLVEAASNSFTDLFNAIQVAAGPQVGATHISMSWGGGEFSGESSYDSYFGSTPNPDGSLPNTPLFFASSGDSGGRTIYPSASPFVVAAGGTSLHTYNGSLVSESGWSGSGGGPSSYEAKPTWQTAKNTSSFARSVPDVSSDADPNTGVAVYWQGQWAVFGGTSVASPCIAGMVNAMSQPNGTTPAYANTTALLQHIYSNTGSFRDITAGHAGHYYCIQGYDYVTGVGVTKAGSY
jgi:subtilase family serine protease